MTDVVVRPARVAEADRIAELMVQLGYEVSEAEIVTRLDHLDDRRTVLVAVVDGLVAGWIAVSADTPFIEGREALVEGLVVDERCRSQGIGERLLHEAEMWALQHACSSLRVQTNVVRERAYRFYERNRYPRVKTQHQLRKRL